MGTVTYPDERVAAFVNEQVVPLQMGHDSGLAKELNVKWTPTLVTLDQDGKEYHRTVGFLGPDELIPSVLLGIGKVHFENGTFDQAIATFDKIVAEFPASASTPEAIFLKGVASYKSTHTPSHLRAAYDKLTADYAGSEWAKRAYPYRLIEA